VQVALDLGGADSIARKEIKSFYGDKILKAKEVQNALQYANESVNLGENYRTAARHGMGTEGKKEARVGLELDYYDKTGTKYMGKIVKKDSKGYTVKDDKSGKMHTFVYHDRIKARKFLQKVGEEGDAEAKAKLNLKHVQDMEKLKGKQTREKENMSEHKNILDAYKQMWEDGVKYAPIDENMERKIMSKMRKGKAPKGMPR